MAANSGRSESRLIGVAWFSNPVYALCPFSLAVGLSRWGQWAISPTRLQARAVMPEQCTKSEATSASPVAFASRQIVGPEPHDAIVSPLPRPVQPAP